MHIKITTATRILLQNKETTEILKGSISASEDRRRRFSVLGQKSRKPLDISEG
jgi:hypothetical protein